MIRAIESDSLAVFPTDLGWMAAVVRGNALCRLTFGHRSAAEASAALGKRAKDLDSGKADPKLVARLQAFAKGKPSALDEVAIADDAFSPFQRKVLAACRAIPYGQTRTYAELAAAAGSPGAARAVGRAMATNPLPLVVPCHRVVATGGELRGYSALGGLATKRRLLDMEQQAASRRKAK